jgi:cyclopropane fatty-acyl-phospholipid synthase-like methyltransferase
MTTDHHRGILAQYSAEVGTAFYRTVMGDGVPVIHYGIYVEPSTSMPQATENATRRLLEIALRKSGIFPPKEIIDLGSGPGGSAHFLAKQTAATVTCVDLCPHHHRENETLAASLGLADRIRTWTGSFEIMPDDWAGKFDLAWSQEALCHASDKPAALREIRRVLRPGGVLVFSDILLSETAPAHEARVFSKVNAVTKLSSAQDHLRDLTEAGFTETEHIDWTPHLHENFRRMRSQITANRDQLLAQGVPAALLESFATSLDQRLAWREGSVLGWGAFVGFAGRA